MATSTSSATAISKGIARPNTDHLMLELKGYDEWDFIDGYARGIEVSESESSEWTLTQATDQSQYPFSGSSSTDSVGNGLDDTKHPIDRRRFGSVPQAHVGAEAEVPNSAPTLLLKPVRKVLDSRPASPFREDEHGGKNNHRWSKLWLRLSWLPSERINQAGKSGRDISESASMREKVPTAGFNMSRWKSILRTGHRHTPSLPEFGSLHKQLEPFSTQRMGHTRSNSERPPIPKRPADEKTWDFLDTMPPSPSFRRRPIYSVPRLSSVPSLPLPGSISSYPDSSVPHLPPSSLQLSSKLTHGGQIPQEVIPVRGVTMKGPSRESSAHYLPQERALSLRSRGRDSARSPGSLRPSTAIKRGRDAPFPISRSSSLGRKSGVGSYF